MKPGKLYGQRELMRELLLKYGYDRRRVCAAYAAADRNGEVRRESDVTGRSSNSYATEMWASGHRPSNQWIVEFCRRHGLKVKRGFWG
jgi:hypothetical protein